MLSEDLEARNVMRRGEIKGRVFMLNRTKRLLGQMSKGHIVQDENKEREQASRMIRY